MSVADIALQAHDPESGGSPTYNAGQVPGVGDDVVARAHPTLAHVLLEVQTLRERQR